MKMYSIHEYKTGQQQYHGPYGYDRAIQTCIMLYELSGQRVSYFAREVL